MQSLGLMQADEPTPLTRPDLRPRHRRLFLGLIVTCVAVGTSVAVVAVGSRVPVASRGAVLVPNVVVRAAAPITVAPPAITIQTTPVPPVTVFPHVAETDDGMPARATSPKLDAACVVIDPPQGDEPAPAACSWDDGFPAISNDGALVVTKHFPEDDGRDTPSLTIRFLDVTTSRVVRDVLIVGADEVDLATDPDDANGAVLRKQLHQRIERRVATAQALIDRRGYRTLEKLVTLDPDEARASGKTEVYAEVEGTAVRAIDPVTNEALWQHRFAAKHDTRGGDGDGECEGWSHDNTDVAWDPETRTVLATMHFHTGGCMCPSASVYEVVRIR